MTMTNPIRTFQICLLTACIALLSAPAFAKNNSSADMKSVTDYSNDVHWSIKDTKIKHPIDVFFVHPTTYAPPANGRYTADINDTKLNEITDINAINWMTAAFSDQCNVFAPRYRQVNFEVLSMPEDKQAHYMSISKSDIKAAFSYYLERLNNGRPFILASHSQGSDLLQLVLLDNPEIFDKEKLVAAYMPGWTFTDRILDQLGLPLGTQPAQTGCVLVWNTVGPGGTSPTLTKGARCVNPLSWTADTKNYPASMNKGAHILQEEGKSMEIKHFTAAHINAMGGLEIPTPKPDIYKKLNMTMGKECYHRYDYDFFFYNIQDNVAQRCKAYLQHHAH